MQVPAEAWLVPWCGSDKKGANLINSAPTNLSEAASRPQFQAQDSFGDLLPANILTTPLEISGRHRR